MQVPALPWLAGGRPAPHYPQCRWGTGADNMSCASLVYSLQVTADLAAPYTVACLRGCVFDAWSSPSAASIVKTEATCSRAATQYDYSSLSVAWTPASSSSSTAGPSAAPTPTPTPKPTPTPTPKPSAGPTPSKKKGKPAPKKRGGGRRLSRHASHAL